METLPNKGLIRFYEAFNREVLIVTSIDAIKEINSVKPYDFGHPKQVKYMLGRITSSSFNFLSEHGHKVRASIPFTSSNFNATTTKLTIPPRPSANTFAQHSQSNTPKSSSPQYGPNPKK